MVKTKGGIKRVAMMRLASPSRLSNSCTTTIPSTAQVAVTKCGLSEA